MPAARPGSLPHGQLSAPCGLRIRAYGSPLARSCLRAACSAHTTPPSGLMKGCQGRASVMRHARAAAHTLRVAVRSAAVTCLSAHVRSIGQRGRQSTRRSTHPAATTRHQPAPPDRSTSDRHPAEAHPEAASGAATEPARNPTSLALPASVNGLQAASPETRNQPRPPRTGERVTNAETASGSPARDRFPFDGTRADFRRPSAGPQTPPRHTT